MYQPRAWPVLAKLLSAAMTGTARPSWNIFLKNITLDKSVPPSTVGAHTAVICADSPDYSGLSEEDAFEEFLNEAVIFQRENLKALWRTTIVRAVTMPSI